MMEGREEFRFRYPLQVRYRDVDRQDIVYFAVYLEYFETALHEYYRALGIFVAETERTREFDAVFAHVEVDYAGSARLDDVVEVGVRAERVGNASITYVLQANLAGTGAPLCRGRLVSVNFDRDTGRARPIPEWIRAAVADYEGLSR
ncbi:MAG TPA: thioesterase family protein [Thermomicrobiaceae bacterium]|nr:thioesterase family protein [Thermomicrobiaceae bacterium]